MSVPLLRKIVVAVDGSEPSLKAVSFASQLAKQTGSKLHILNVIMLPAYASQPTLENLRAELSKKSAQILEKSEALAKTAKVETDTKVVETTQSVVERIVEYSDMEKADLIILGSRGTTMGKLMLGSIAAGTANLAHCPVLVVR
jgi:nucleotide-binding universal stress UspA family protein